MRLFQPTVSVERRLSTEIVKQSFTDLTKPETDQTEQEVEQEARGEALMMIENVNYNPYLIHKLRENFILYYLVRYLRA